MAIKEKQETIDFDTDFQDIPLFATVDDVVGNIQIDDSKVNIKTIPQEDEK